MGQMNLIPPNYEFQWIKSVIQLEILSFYSAQPVFYKILESLVEPS